MNRVKMSFWQYRDWLKYMNKAGLDLYLWQTVYNWSYCYVIGKKRFLTNFDIILEMKFPGHTAQQAFWDMRLHGSLEERAQFLDQHVLW